MAHIVGVMMVMTEQVFLAKSYHWVSEMLRSKGVLLREDVGSEPRDVEDRRRWAQEQARHVRFFSYPYSSRTSGFVNCSERSGPTGRIWRPVAAEEETACWPTASH